MFFKQPPTSQPFIPAPPLPILDFALSVSFYCQNLNLIIVQTPFATFLLSALYGLRGGLLPAKWHPSQALLSLTNDPLFLPKQDFKQMQVDPQILEALATQLQQRHQGYFLVKRCISPIISSNKSKLYQKSSNSQVLLIETEDQVQTFELQEYFQNQILCLILVVQKISKTASEVDLNLQQFYSEIKKQNQNEKLNINQKFDYVKIEAFYRSKNADSVKQGPYYMKHEMIWSPTVEEFIQQKLENAISYEYAMHIDEKIDQYIKLLGEKHK